MGHRSITFAREPHSGFHFAPRLALPTLGGFDLQALTSHIPTFDAHGVLLRELYWTVFAARTDTVVAHGACTLVDIGARSSLPRARVASETVSDLCLELIDFLAAGAVATRAFAKKGTLMTVDYFELAPKYQGAGMGAKLLDELISQFKAAEGISCLLLKPYPLQFIDSPPHTLKGKALREFEVARDKLADHYALRWGFQKAGATGWMVRPLLSERVRIAGHVNGWRLRT